MAYANRLAERNSVLISALRFGSSNPDHAGAEITRYKRQAVLKDCLLKCLMI